MNKYILQALCFSIGTIVLGVLFGITAGEATMAGMGATALTAYIRKENFYV